MAQELSRRGADLRILIRPTSKLENLAGLPAETVTGDLLQVDALRSAISGCDAVMHVAADYRLWVTDPERMLATNVAGTRGLLRIARARTKHVCSVWRHGGNHLRAAFKRTHGDKGHMGPLRSALVSERRSVIRKRVSRLVHWCVDALPELLSGKSFKR